jgi:D-alanine-D-alanine ligase
MTKKLRVGVLFGGKSAEHEVSLQSARNIINSLDKDKYEVVPIGIDKVGKWLLGDSSKELFLNSADPEHIAINVKESREVAPMPYGGGVLANREADAGAQTLDVVFPVLHGPMGEDGTMQGLLTLAGVPFVGPDVLGSAVGMDKDVCKRLLRDAGIPVAPFVVIKADDAVPAYEDIVQVLGEPCFLKPANLGSSVGVHKVHSKEEYDAAVTDAFKYDVKILIEKFIKGREIEVAVLGNSHPDASVPGEIIPQHEFYSYEAKYLDEKGALLEIPAKLSDEKIKEAQELAKKTFVTLACEGMARVDMFLTPTGELYINEINTIPGFTNISMYPKLWEASGLTQPALLDKLIALALERHARKQVLRTSFES